MAPWPRAPVIPQLVDRKTFRDNRWVRHWSPAGKTIKPIVTWKMGVHSHRRCHNSSPKKSISRDCSGPSWIQFLEFTHIKIVPSMRLIRAAIPVLRTIKK
ncbi:hypothetical protein TNCV_3014241 [Trichonephila clavipes]|nr:hypothetical protein TNCV_3014241 [Trichonephila clavipes]